MIRYRYDPSIGKPNEFVGSWTAYVFFTVSVHHMVGRYLKIFNGSGIMTLFSVLLDICDVWLFMQCTFHRSGSLVVSSSVDTLFTIRLSAQCISSHSLQIDRDFPFDFLAYLSDSNAATVEYVHGAHDAAALLRCHHCVYIL